MYFKPQLKMILVALACVTFNSQLIAAPSKASSIVETKVVQHYTTLAHTIFEDALITAKALDATLAAFIESPSQASLEKAQLAWKAARIPYLQSEVFRFGNPNVDDWEGQVNAWPLDEGLIDYVAQDYAHEEGNTGATANIVAAKSIKVGNKTIDTTSITPKFLAEINELGGSEANVATGYHAIEFLLWGQDLNGTQAGAGERPYTAFITGDQCTGGHCERRIQYLKAASSLLINDLQDMVAQWAPSTDNYRAKFEGLPKKEALTRILYGMGSLSLGELAGERMKVALDANSPEDEQDCFSDNTHHSHYFNAKGVQNLYDGQYQRANGQLMQGLGIAALVEPADPALHKSMQAALQKTEQALNAIVTLAEKDEPMKFDQLIAPNNTKGEAIVQEGIMALVNQAQSIEQVAKAVGIDNLNPDTSEHHF